ncbi:hypothetical protein [Methanobrevibacter sp.]
MSDKTVLLEEKKEITTFLLDEGDITETVNVLPNGNMRGYDYSGIKIHAEDVVTISGKSEIGKIHVRRYCEDNDDCLIFGIAVNSPVTMTGGKRKTAILILGHIFRLKLASGIKNVNVKDRIQLTPNGAVVNDDGTFFAMHPVEDSDKYHFVEVFLPYNSSACMPEPIPPCGTYWQTTENESVADISSDFESNFINKYGAKNVGLASDNAGEFYLTAVAKFFEDPIFAGALVKQGSDVYYNDSMQIKFKFKIEGYNNSGGFGFCIESSGYGGVFIGAIGSKPGILGIGDYEEDLYPISDNTVILQKNTEYGVIFTNNPEDENYVMEVFDESNELISTVNFSKSYIFDNPYSEVDKTKALHFGIVSQSWVAELSKFIIKDVEIKTPIRN